MSDLMDNGIYYIAHVTKNNETGEWNSPHELSEHLLDTSILAKQFAASFGEDWAELAGRWHDLGKYRKRFQEYIRIQTDYDRENANIENGIRAPHSTAGAIHAVKSFPPGFGHIIAYLIAGHHAGLPDWFNGRGSLDYRLKEGMEEYQQAIKEDIPIHILQGDCPQLPKVAQSTETIALWVRMLFSCLVDADFLDTEAYMQPDKSEQRKSDLSLNVLQKRFALKMTLLQKNSQVTVLNTIRNQILKECQKAAIWQPGLFSLTVPTGGGKTLSSLAFALEHAKIHKKSRIIFAIPFTSIIEQNADVFRQFLGKDAVLEHHSSLDVEPDRENSKARLATENWNAPLIVTTNVQLFESLHASRTSRCRKLHNLINSVIILDEAQQIPRDFHAPITQVMQQLSDHFGVTWVLCTATQPELKEAKNTFGQVLLKGLKEVREIVSDPTSLIQQLKRVEVILPTSDEPRWSWQEISENLAQEDCVLAIVNTRKNARDLFELLPDDENNLHLSAHMCAAHRSEVIEEIKQRLKLRVEGDARPLRVVSTQLIEAGVDVDFPVVYRAIAGLDSIAQSAGRCNREGKLEHLGRVVVFKPEKASPAGFLKQGEETTTEMIKAGLLEEPLAPTSFSQYFERMNARGERDKHQILDLLKMKSSQDAPLVIQFREAAKKFRLIDNIGESVIVPFRPHGQDSSPVDSWINMLEKDPSQKWIYKKLQRYTISLPEHLVEEYRKNGCLEERAGLRILFDHFYHEHWGANSPETLISAEESVF